MNYGKIALLVSLSCLILIGGLWHKINEVDHKPEIPLTRLYGIDTNRIYGSYIDSSAPAGFGKYYVLGSNPHLDSLVRGDIGAQQVQVIERKLMTPAGEPGSYDPRPTICEDTATNNFWFTHSEIKKKPKPKKLLGTGFWIKGGLPYDSINDYPSFIIDSTFDSTLIHELRTTNYYELLGSYDYNTWIFKAHNITDSGVYTDYYGTGKHSGETLQLPYGGNTGTSALLLKGSITINNKWKWGREDSVIIKLYVTEKDYLTAPFPIKDGQVHLRGWTFTRAGWMWGFADYQGKHLDLTWAHVAPDQMDTIYISPFYNHLLNQTGIQ